MSVTSKISAGKRLGSVFIPGDPCIVLNNIERVIKLDFLLIPSKGWKRRKSSNAKK